MCPQTLQVAECHFAMQSKESMAGLFAEKELHRLKQLWDQTCCLSTSKQRKDIVGIGSYGRI